MERRYNPPDRSAKLRGTLQSLLVIAAVAILTPAHPLAFVVCFAVVMSLLLVRAQGNLYPLSFALGVLAILLATYIVRFSA